ncbi:hypothetical protein GOV03_03165 [Candidatus Woesearchaeota archaeon]|nr:hypothetical protein [Candidatus Woesearchaeota archaeon]
MRKKGAIGLSVNMLVIIIISLVIFGGAMALLFNLVEGAEDAKATLDQKTDAELRRLLEIESKKVALPLHTAYLYAGDFHTFGLGILNIEEEQNFDITITPHKAFDPEENDITFNPEELQTWLLFKAGPYIIKSNEYQTIPIGVEVPKGTAKGTYIFNVDVLAEGIKYDTVKKFYVVVK